METTTLSLQDRIDRLAIAYIENHYDVKNMSVSDFMEKFNETCGEICNSLNGIKN